MTAMVYAAMKILRKLHQSLFGSKPSESFEPKGNSDTQSLFGFPTHEVNLWIGKTNEYDLEGHWPPLYVEIEFKLRNGALKHGITATLSGILYDRETNEPANEPIESSLTIAPVFVVLERGKKARGEIIEIYTIEQVQSYRIIHDRIYTDLN